MYWIALDYTGAPNKVASQCKLNCYLLLVLVAFSADQLFKPADSVKKGVAGDSDSVNQILSRITEEHLHTDTDSLTLLTASS